LRFRALVLIGVATVFCAAVIPHITKPCVASKPTDPVACSPQWLPVLLALSFQPPLAPHNGRLTSAIAGLFKQLRPLDEPPREFLSQVYDTFVVPHEHLALCKARINGIHVKYVQVWKANTQGICEVLRQMDDHGNTSSEFFFTFVRPPIEKFVSGFSEIAWRATVKPVRVTLKYLSSAGCRNVSFRAELSAKSQANTFLADFIYGVATKECFGSDAFHAFPSMAFISAALRNNLVPRIDFVGRLDSFSEDWSELMHLVGVEPQSKDAKRKQTKHHPLTSAESGFQPREKMTTYLLLSPESTLQLCIIFLPDFICLNYPLPPACQKLAFSRVIPHICATCNRRKNTSLFNANAAECEDNARNLAA